MNIIETNLLAVRNENKAILIEMANYSKQNDAGGWATLEECEVVGRKNSENREIIRERILANSVLLGHVKEQASHHHDLYYEVDYLIYNLTKGL